MEVCFTLQQYDSLSNKVVNTSHKMRAMDLGQDRYRRRYWVLHQCGGVFVEGMESSEPDACLDEEKKLAADTQEMSDKDTDNSSEKENTNSTESESQNGKLPKEDVSEIKHIMNGDQDMELCDNKLHEKKDCHNVKQIEKEKMEMMNGERMPENGMVIKTEEKTIKREGEKCSIAPGMVAKTKHELTVMKEESLMNGNHAEEESSAFKSPGSSSALYLPKSDTSGNFMSELYGTYNKNVPSDVTTSSPKVFNSSYNNSIHINSTHSEMPSPFRSIESLIGPDRKSNPSSPYLGGSFLMSNMMSPTSTSSPISAEQMLKTLSQNHQNDCGWFSILPRMPCDETSLTRCPNNSTSRPESSLGGAGCSSPTPSSPFTTSSPYPAFQGRSTPADISSVNNSAAFHSFNPGTPQSGCDIPNPYTDIEALAKLQHQHPKPIPLGKCMTYCCGNLI